MKTIKPLRLGVLHRTYEHERACRLVVTAIALFPFEAQRRLLPDVALWKLVAAELGKDAALDACMNKARGELLVTGRCFAPGGVPRVASSVRVRLGSIDKTLYVVGNRTWKRGAPSDPEPFTEMPVSYAHAFGGEGFAQNPLGKGAVPIETAAGEVQPLPNVEDPKSLVTSPRDRPAPAGLDAYDFTWPQRFSKAGTYDQAWLEDRYPGFPKDIDWGIWSAAPPDQQIGGFFRGDEAFVLENMHPTKPRIEGSLPGVVARCFINQRTPEGEAFREIEMVADTVHLFPHAERGVVLFRGVTTVREDDAGDVLQLVVACEAKGAPRPIEHYRAVLAARLDRSRPELLIRDSDLMPPAVPGEAPHPDEKLSDAEDLLATERLLLENTRRGAEKQIEAVRQEIRDAGLDPALYPVPALPPLPKAPSLEELPELVASMRAQAAEAKEEAEKQRAEAEKEGRALCAKHGVDYERAVADARKRGTGPPEFSAEAELAKLRDAQELGRNAGVSLPHVEARLADPELPKKLAAAEAQLEDAYRRTAHHMPAVELPEEARRRALREEIVMKAAAGISLEGRDLTGAALEGLDLHGADLSGAFLESADLFGADLSGANLTRAVLTRANLETANLENAVLVEANLGAARLRHAVLRGADLTRATLAKAELAGADFGGATLVSADVSETRFAGADLTGVKASGLLLMKADLLGLTLCGADLSKCNFLEANVEGVDFGGAKLTSAVFLTAKGDGAVFRGASLGNLRVVMGSSFAGADFGGADLGGANLRGTRLAGADLREANLTGADLSECDLRGARLAGAIAVDTRFAKADLSGADVSRANLMQVILQNAKVHGASFEHANLFRADAAFMRGDAKTSFEGALTKRVRIVKPRGTDGPG